MTLIQLADTLYLDVSENDSPHDIIKQQKTLSNFWKVSGNKI
ncbi:hypothetical protein [Enterococcus gallinarum]|nr:hypothetical protein [Enterococcus gallinarum]